MKVDNSANAIGAYASQSKVAKRDTGVNKPTGKTSSADTVELSSASSLAQKAGTDSSFDAGKVDAIKSAIASGSFSINPEKIADSLIASTREFLSQ